MLERQQLSGALRLVEQFERRGKAQALEASHQGLIAKHGAGGRFDDRLEGVFYDKLGERYDLVITEAAKRQKFYGGGGHAELQDRTYDARQHRGQASTKAFADVKVL
ncbi:hypothetical protein EFR01_31080 [Sinorhizobium fredii]|nr:hypothetical protein EFR01_31080 [Sinorhizobium fredii]GLS10587.1 hypothetical protein GCM10007864_42180 [Sinorhizobium fredii]